MNFLKTLFKKKQDTPKPVKIKLDSYGSIVSQLIENALKTQNLASSDVNSDYLEKLDRSFNLKCADCNYLFDYSERKIQFFEIMWSRPFIENCPKCGGEEGYLIYGMQETA